MDIQKFLKCDKCGGKGFTYSPDGKEIKMCSCTGKHNFVRRMKNSGLLGSFDKFTFDSYECREPWQTKMLDRAKEYVRDGVEAGNWIYFGGQPGCGKTHLATAIVGDLLEKYDCLYVVWTTEIQKIKAVIVDTVEYDKRVGRLQEIDVLFIDDFLKPAKDKEGNVQCASSADIRIAFDILNYRYLNDKVTIISSEWFLQELMGVDEATASRIYEKCGKYKININRDISRNYRCRDDENF